MPDQAEPIRQAPGDAMSRTQSVYLFGCPFDRVDLHQAVAQVEAAIAQRGRLTQSVGVNLDQLLKMQEDPAFREIILQCDQITADGQPIIWLSRLFGDPLPERVPSVDIMEALLPLAATKGYKIFLLGTKQELLDRAAEAMRQKHPGLPIVGQRNGYFKEEDEPEIVRQINESGADMLFVAISSPKKEQFVERNRAALQVPFVMGVGGAFDIAAGQYTRAPRLVQKVGLEWAWRVAQEPKRMGPRVLHDLKFGKYVAREALRRAFRLDRVQLDVQALAQLLEQVERELALGLRVAVHDEVVDVYHRHAHAHLAQELVDLRRQRREERWARAAPERHARVAEDAPLGAEAQVLPVVRVDADVVEAGRHVRLGEPAARAHRQQKRL
jgi:N-acetylglucosaminyldiphosphoundecaprenol N-acetyl-beta-D-mannosaminyltransferase